MGRRADVTWNLYRISTNLFAEKTIRNRTKLQNNLWKAPATVKLKLYRPTLFI